jgi:hypothetical protein
MGRKRIGTGKQIYFCVAGLILLFLSGCTTVEKKKERVEVQTVSAEPGESAMTRPPVTSVPVIVAPPKEKREHMEIREPVSRGQKLLSQGDYEGFLKENEKVLSQSGNKSGKDEALFNLGLFYAHPENPKKDYGKSLSFLRRLLKEYPQSPLSDQARVWLEILQENQKLTEMIEKSKQIDLEIEERKREKVK